MKLLIINVPALSGFDEDLEQFVHTKACTLQLEHSLISLSKWEAEWHKPFLSEDKKTDKESNDYIRCMHIGNNIDNRVFNLLPPSILKQIHDYIINPMTASTVVKKKKNTINNETITSELVYYWMVALTIPFECQKWHLNRLIMLIDICNAKNQPAEKKSEKEIIEQYRNINEENKKRFNSKG